MRQSPPIRGISLSEDRRIRGGTYDAAIDRAFRAVLRKEVSIVRSAASTVPLIDDLVGGRRAWKELTAQEVRSLRGLPMVDLHLKEAQASRHHDPQRQVAAARLARAAAHGLDLRVYGPQVVADARARAWAELANAYRANDELDRAEQVMKTALHYLERGSGDLLLEARLLELSASLFVDQRSFAYAREVLERVFALYKGIGDDHLAGRTLIKLSHVVYLHGDAATAIRLQTRGSALIDLSREPGLGPLVLQNMISLLSEAGMFRKAQHLLWQSRISGRLPQGENARLKMLWTEGRIHVGLGQLDRAESVLLRAKEGLDGFGQGYDAGLVALDLAALWLGQGKQRQVRDLAAKLVSRFRELGVARETIAAVTELRRACEREKATADMAKRIAEHLRDATRRPDVSLPPPRLV
jgi:tetratricopeptide (TPR) repeat protein